jgi:AraC-like DNA-binding protein
MMAGPSSWSSAFESDAGDVAGLTRRRAGGLMIAAEGCYKPAEARPDVAVEAAHLPAGTRARRLRRPQNANQGGCGMNVGEPTVFVVDDEVRVDISTTQRALGYPTALCEHRLMLAVLEDAVRVYQVDCLSTHTGSRLRFRETAAWFAADDTSSPFCFVTICEVFGLDPDYVRGGLRRWKDTHTSDAPRTGRVIPFPTRHVAGSVPRSPVRLPAPAATETPCEILAEGVSSAPVPDFVTSIRQAVETLSRGDDYPSVQQTADFVGISVRTLQRALAAREVNHEALVAETRFAAAAALLERADGTILDIALSLGYSDHANFSRAFRRWAGCSPREYRLRCGRIRQVRPAAARARCEAQRRHRRAS